MLGIRNVPWSDVRNRSAVS